MTKKHRRHSMSKKREVVEAYFHGESMRGLSEKHDISRTLIPIWIDKYERGEFDDDAIEEELLPEYETRIAALERLVGRQALEIEFLKTARARVRSQRSAPTGLSTRIGCDVTFWNATSSRSYHRNPIGSSPRRSTGRPTNGGT